MQLDDNISRKILELLPSRQTTKWFGSSLSLFSGMPSATSSLENEADLKSAQLFTALSQPARAGACALTSLLDADRGELYVALAGDCRAVAGWQTEDGQWRSDVLTADQMGQNPSEVARCVDPSRDPSSSSRMKSEHPKAEDDTVIMRGRVMGGLEPTRAFGDATYKWTVDEAQR